MIISKYHLRCNSFKIFLKLFWNTVDLQCHVNFCRTAKWFNHIHLYIPFHILFHYGLSKDIVYSSLCYIVAPCCLLRCNSYSNSLVAPKMSFAVTVSKLKSTWSLFEIRRVFFFPYWPFIFHHINFCLVDFSSLWTSQITFLWCDFSSVQSLSRVYLRPHGLQHTRSPCPSPIPRVYSNSCPLSQWCHPTISSSVIPFSSHLQSFLASGSFQMSQFFASGGQSIGASASTSVLPVNTQDWSPLGWTGWISLQSKGFSRVLSNTTVQKYQFFRTQIFL